MGVYEKIVQRFTAQVRLVAVGMGPCCSLVGRVVQATALRPLR